MAAVMPGEVIIVVVVALALLFVLFCVWASKSIPRAIVFAVVFITVFPVVLIIGFVAVVAFSENADSGRPQHIEKSKR
jgi:hypothetical protein